MKRMIAILMCLTMLFSFFTVSSSAYNAYRESNEISLSEQISDSLAKAIRDMIESIFSFLRQFSTSRHSDPRTEDPPTIRLRGSNVTVTFYDYVNSAHGPVETDDMRALESASYITGQDIAFPTVTEKDWSTYYTFRGWSLTPNGPIVDHAVANEDEVAYYAVYDRIPVQLVAKPGTTTVIDRNGYTISDYDEASSYWYIYGMEEMMTESDFYNYCEVQGDGRIRFQRKIAKYAPYVGTGTMVYIYDNATDKLVEMFFVIIYGDLNGDAYVTVDDATRLRNELQGHTEWSNPTSAQYNRVWVKAADLDVDGILTWNDRDRLFDGFTYTLINQVDPRLTIYE